MAELFIAIAELCVLLVQMAFWAIYALVYAVLRLLGMGETMPAPNANPLSKQNEDQRSRTMVHLVTLVIAIAIFGGSIGYYAIQSNIKQKRKDTAKHLVEAQAKRLDLNQNPTPAREPGFAQQHVDPWGQPVRVVYRDHLTHHTVEVRSAGRDKKSDTWDDHVATRRKLRVAGKVAAPAGKAAAAAAMGGAIKLWQYRQEKKQEAIDQATQTTP